MKYEEPKFDGITIIKICAIMLVSFAAGYIGGMEAEIKPGIVLNYAPEENHVSERKAIEP